MIICGSCVYEPDKDLQKYQAIYILGRLRIVLQPVGANLLTCPKCGLTCARPGFKRTERSEKTERIRKSDTRVEQLKQLFHH
jgi:hypothetical protein